MLGKINACAGRFDVGVVFGGIVAGVVIEAALFAFKSGSRLCKVTLCLFD